MVRKIVVLLALASVVGVLLLQAGTASALPTFSPPCSNCHTGVTVSVNITPASGTIFTYTITGPNSISGWAVVNSSGSTVLTGQGASGTIDMTTQATGTYTFWGVNTPSGTANSGAASKQFTVSAPPTNTPVPPTATNTATATATKVPPTATNTATATATTVPPTATNTATATATKVATATPTNTATATATKVATATPTNTATATATKVATATPTNTATATSTPSPTATSTPSPTVTATPTPPPAPGGDNVIYRGKGWLLTGTVESISTDGHTWTIDGTPVQVNDATNLRGNPAVGSLVLAKGKGSQGDPLVATTIAALKGNAPAAGYGVDYFGGPMRSDD